MDKSEVISKFSLKKLFLCLSFDDRILTILQFLKLINKRGGAINMEKLWKEKGAVGGGGVLLSPQHF